MTTRERPGVLPLDEVVDHRVLPHTDGSALVRLPDGAAARAWTADAEVCGAQLLELPVGGPYAMEVTRDGEVIRRIEDVLVGDVWLLAGQSNMAGGGALPETPAPSALTRVLGVDGAWGPCVEPVHRYWRAADNPLVRAMRLLCYPELDDHQWTTYVEQQSMADSVRPVGGVGPGACFASCLSDRTGVPVGLVPCALGATSLLHWRRDWAAAAGCPRADTLYDHLLVKARASGPVRGLLWYQGEGDTGPGLGETYLERFTAFLDELREDLEQPDLRVLAVQIGRYDLQQLRDVLSLEVDPSDVPGWQAVREALRRAAHEIPHVEVVAAADLPLADGIHLNGAGQELLGRRLANLASGRRRAPRLAGVTVARDRRQLRLRFADVVGPLVLRGPCDVWLDGKLIRDLSVDRDELVLSLLEPCPTGAHLTYGGGLVPRVGLFDSEGMPMPLLGPVLVP